MNKKVLSNDKGVQEIRGLGIGRIKGRGNLVPRLFLKKREEPGNEVGARHYIRKWRKGLPCASKEGLYLEIKRRSRKRSLSEDCKMNAF